VLASRNCSIRCVCRILEIFKTSYRTNNFSIDPAPLPLGELVDPWRIRQIVDVLCRSFPFFSFTRYSSTTICFSRYYGVISELMWVNDVKDRIWRPTSKSREGLRFAAVRAEHPPSLILRARVFSIRLVFLTTFSLPLASSSLTPRGGIV